MRNEAGKALLPFVLLCLLAAGMIFVLPQATLGVFGRFLVVREEVKRADGIVVLLGGDGPDRVKKAFELYQKKIAPRLIFGSGFVDREALRDMPPNFVWVAPASRYELAFESLGVKKEDIFVVNTETAFDTASELSLIRDAVQKQKWRSVILVTSAPHSRRVSLIWSRVAPSVPAFTVAADDEKIGEWWKDSREIRAVGYEAGALVKEGVRQLLHLLEDSPLPSSIKDDASPRT